MIAPAAQRSSTISLEEVYEEYQADPAFDHLSETYRFVPGVGDTNADILFIGEAPGKTEDTCGVPFVGPAGDVLEEMLEEVFSDIYSGPTTYFTNVLKYRPGERNRDPHVSEIQASIPYLTQEINEINPYLIVLLGRIPTRTFYPGEVFKNIRGKVLDRRGRKVLATYHPAAILYHKDKLPEYQEHFAKIGEIVADYRSAQAAMHHANSSLAGRLLSGDL
jgi:DNA polymerase